MQEKDRSADRVSFEQMLTQERLITIGRLTPGIMHEINNPLQVIRGALQLAQDDIDKPVVLQEYITISQQEIEHITRLLGQVRLIYRSQSDGPEAFHLPELMRNAIALTEEEGLRQKVSVKNHLPYDLPLVRGVFNQLYIAVLRALLALMDVIGQAGGGELAIMAEVTDRLRLSYRVIDSLFRQDPGLDLPPSQELLARCQLTGSASLVAANGGLMEFRWNGQSLLLCMELVKG